MATSAEQARARELAQLRVFERDVREGHKYREAMERLDAAIMRGDTESTLAIYRFMVALYAPFKEG